MVPKFVDPGTNVLFGFENDGWLNELKNSVRNCSLARSVRTMFLNRDRSKFTKPGPVKIFRPVLPYVKGSGRPNDEIGIQLTLGSPPQFAVVGERMFARCVA